MNTCIYDKTDKGRDEIATRQHHLQARLRTLLLLIDGQRQLGDLLRNTEGLGLNADNVAQLEAEGFITLVKGPDPEPVAAAAARKPGLRRTMGGRRPMPAGATDSASA